MKNILKVRKLKVRYYVVMLLVLVLAIWLNVKVLKMDNVTCLTAGNGTCTELETFNTYQMLAYASIVLFSLMVLYIYLFNGRIDRRGTGRTFEEITTIIKTVPIETPSKEKVTEKIVVKKTVAPEKVPTKIVVPQVAPEVVVKDLKQVVVQTSDVTAVKVKKVVKRKKDVINDVSNITKLSKYKSAQVVNAIFDEITKELVQGAVVNIETFGKFNKYKVAAHTGINPGTGEKITVEAHNRVKYSPSIEFKQFLNQ